MCICAPYYLLFSVLGCFCYGLHFMFNNLLVERSIFTVVGYEPIKLHFLLETISFLILVNVLRQSFFWSLRLTHSFVYTVGASDVGGGYHHKFYCLMHAWTAGHLESIWRGTEAGILSICLISSAYLDPGLGSSHLKIEDLRAEANITRKRNHPLLLTIVYWYRFR